MRWAGIVLGGAIFLGFATQVAGLNFTSASRSAFITGTFVAMVPFFARNVLRLPLRFQHLTASFIALTGVFLLTRPDLSSINVGDILTLICAAIFAWHLVLLQKFSQPGLSRALTFYQIAAVTIIAFSVGRDR